MKRKATSNSIEIKIIVDNKRNILSVYDSLRLNMLIISLEWITRQIIPFSLLAYDNICSFSKKGYLNFAFNLHEGTSFFAVKLYGQNISHRPVWWSAIHIRGYMLVSVPKLT